MSGSGEGEETTEGSHEPETREGQSGSQELGSEGVPPTSSAPSSASADSEHSMGLPDDEVCVCVCVYIRGTVGREYSLPVMTCNCQERQQ